MIRFSPGRASGLLFALAVIGLGPSAAPAAERPNSVTIEYDITQRAYVDVFGGMPVATPSTGSFSVRYEAVGVNTIVAGPSTLLTLSAPGLAYP